MNTVEYIAPRGGRVTFGISPPFVLLTKEGFGDTRLTEQTQRSPYQVGESLVGVQAASRVVTLSTLVAGKNIADLNEKMSELSSVMALEPSALLQEVETGLLRYYRKGLPTVELPVVPRQSPQFGRNSFSNVEADIEFYCPYPYWQEAEESHFELREDGGFTFPMELPLEMPSFNIQQEITNQGDVPAPMTARVYGACESPRFINESTGEEIALTGSLSENEYIEISTEYGKKRVTLVRNGERTNAMNRLNVDVSTFFQLRRGANRIRFEATNNTSGRALVYWRARYGGV